MKTDNTEDQLPLKQEARAKLRESFLKAVNSLHGERCSILTYEQSKLTGTLSSWKPDGTEVLIHDLKTPANIVMSSALLRTPDILAIQLDKPVVLQI
ncbi:PREDICTED: uncharacterized protein LOC106107323 [Papilio polytes]|uniref:uncharacterized protein LOC106107323 n=1 Tax=Papilio polytes TaxID=76194 RepID=UPI0006763CD8|nr:PREDICTED: uncharacterized protein LOC106107323 [Papilio polytes]